MKLPRCHGADRQVNNRLHTSEQQIAYKRPIGAINGRLGELTASSQKSQPEVSVQSRADKVGSSAPAENEVAQKKLKQMTHVSRHLDPHRTRVR